MDHAIFDKRKYPVVDVREGYGEWVRTFRDAFAFAADLVRQR